MLLVVVLHKSPAQHTSSSSFRIVVVASMHSLLDLVVLVVLLRWSLLVKQSFGLYFPFPHIYPAVRRWSSFVAERVYDLRAFQGAFVVIVPVKHIEHEVLRRVQLLRIISSCYGVSSTLTHFRAEGCPLEPVFALH